MDNAEIKREKDYLKAVLYTLQRKIEGSEELLKDAEKSISEHLKYAWDNKLEDYEWAEVKLNINRKEATEVNAKNRIASYGKMLKNAYFARIDFDDGEEVTPIYIGIATLEDGNYFYVYDWRAPISSMFYDFELGEAFFESPNGIVRGKIVLKRQYKIEGDKITQIFDTSMQIIDDVLQEILASHATSKMRNIVTSIQKEQNKIIRRLDSDILVVSGPAGSGKTSVAMHRVAYLLYAYKNTLKNNNVLILSPNDIFSNYVSNVLPEIGEDNVYQTTFADFVAAFLTEFKIKESSSDIYEFVYSEVGQRTPPRFNSIKLKTSSFFINLIETYLNKKRGQILSIEDVVVDNKVIIDREFLEKFATSIETKGLTYKEQAIAIIDKILLHIDIKFNRNKEIKNRIKKSLVANFNKIKAKDLYINLFADKEAFVSLVEEVYNASGEKKENRLNIKQLSDVFEVTNAALTKGVLPYEDISGYLYLKDRLTGFKTQKEIKQVVIDEGQDYSLMQYKLLSHVFKNAKITVLGDPDQCILPFEPHKSFESIANVLKQDKINAKCAVTYLSKTYRSTVQINEFAAQILGNKPSIHQVERKGNKVRVIKDIDNVVNSAIITDARALKAKGGTVAIITKTDAQARYIKESLQAAKVGNGFKYVTKKDRTFNADKIMIIPVYLAKGLEFDSCLIYEANEKEYPIELKNLFYVACTRALHELRVYYTGNVTKLLGEDGGTRE